MSTIETEIDLQKFCMKDDRLSRYTMTRPWVNGGWRYATDASDDVPGVEEKPFPPPVPFFNHPPIEPTPWPDTPIVREVDKCPQCDGNGELGCEECEEVGCLMCDGAGEFEQDIYQMIGAHRIAAKYAKMIATLSNVRYFPNDKPLSPLMFLFDGGAGAVMGTVKGSDD